MNGSLAHDADELDGGQDIFGLTVDRDWCEVRRYQPTNSGHEVTVSVVRLPARFWRIQCPDLDLDLLTGARSDMPALADSIAEAIAEGMLGANDELEWS